MKKYQDIVKCPLCNSKNIAQYMDTLDYFFTKENFSLTKCNDCNFVFTNPVPTELGKYYETTDYFSHNTSSNGILGKVYSKLRNINIQRKYKLVKKYNAEGSILDIGCGTGELLNYFNSKSWNTLGIEPNKSARNFAKEKYNLEVNTEEELSTLKPKSFEVISMWHVLEHVQNLHERIKLVIDLLKDDGTIFIALPNLNSPDSNKYGKYWSALDVPRHLYHFTKNSFTELCSLHNLKIVHAEPMKFDAYYVSMLSEKYKNNRNKYLTAFFAGFQSNLYAKKDNNYSSMIYVIKKETI